MLRRLAALACGGIAATALFALMALTVVDVAGRKFFDASLPGALELTELLMVAVIFSALPLASLRREHVVFDMLDPLLPPLLRRVQQALVDALCAAALAGLAGLMAVKAQQTAGYGDITAQLKLPVAPFVAAMGLACAAAAAVHAALAWRACFPQRGPG